MKTPLRVMHRTDKKTLGNVYKQRGSILCGVAQAQTFRFANRAINGKMTTTKGETMKITATSEFHDTLSVSFRGCKEGYNIRRLRGPRSNYCLDYSHANSHVCGCGYPVSRTIWDAGDTYGVKNVSECGPDGDCYGKGYLSFDVYNVAELEAAQKEAYEAQQAALLANLNEDGTFKH